MNSVNFFKNTTFCMHLSALALLLILAVFFNRGCIGGAPSFEPANVTAEQEANSALQLLSFGEVRFDVRESSAMAQRLDKVVDKATGDIRIKSELARGVALFLEGDFTARKYGKLRSDALKSLRSAERALGVAAGMESENADVWLFQALIWGRAAGLDRNNHSEFLHRMYGNIRAISRMPDDFETKYRWFGRRWDMKDIRLYESRMYCDAGRPWLAMTPEMEQARSSSEPLAMIERARLLMSMRMPTEAAAEIFRLASPRYRNRTYTGEGLWMLKGCMEAHDSTAPGDPKNIEELIAEIAPPFADSSLMNPIPEAVELAHGEADLAILARQIMLGAYDEADVIIRDLTDGRDDYRGLIRWRDLDGAARECTLALNVLKFLSDPKSSYEDIITSFEKLSRLQLNSFMLQSLYQKWLDSTAPVVNPPLFPGSSPSIVYVGREKTRLRGIELLVRVLDPQGIKDVASVTMNIEGEEGLKSASQDSDEAGLWRFKTPWEPEDKEGLLHLRITARDVSGYADTVPFIYYCDTSE